MPSRKFTSEDWLATGLIAAFFLFNLIGLDRVPFANADEAWIAEPGLHYWQHGTFASSLHAGFFGTERHYLIHAPLFSILVGWMIWIFGPGLIQIRLVSLAMSAAVAGMTYRLGRELLSPRHGLIATLFLTWWRSGPYQWEARQSGIVLVDFARLARYDIAVPFFGLIGVLLILPWLLHRDVGRWRFALAGITAGMATACHPIGLLCLATLVILCVVAQKRTAVAPIAWMVAGFAVSVLPLVLFVYAGWDDAMGQQRLQHGRWGFGDPWFYAWNVLREWRRYISVGRGLQFGIPGAWLFVGCSVTGGLLLLRRQRQPLIFAALLTGFILLALCEREKFFFYLAALWPWIALAVAMGFVAATQSSTRVLRIGAMVVLALACADGMRAEVLLAREAATRAPYDEMCDRLAAQIPREARVLALPTWWIGLGPHVRDYRSLTVPMFFLQPHLIDPNGPTFTERLAAIDADVLLFDQAMIDYVHGPRAAWALEQGPGTRNPGAEELEQFVATHTKRRIEVIDPAYGRFELYFLR